jgi:signal transduction histidine kinase
MGVVTELQIPADLPMVDVDAVQIQQVLVNLLRNAFDATVQSGVSRPLVKISAETVGDGRMVEVKVTDNGAGLPEDVAIFDAFKTTKPNGMGLGLAIGTTIIEAHQGTLTAANVKPHGAVFRFTLPVAPYAQGIESDV